jgi:hypothetical protein
MPTPRLGGNSDRRELKFRCSAHRLRRKGHRIRDVRSPNAPRNAQRGPQGAAKRATTRAATAPSKALQRPPRPPTKFIAATGEGDAGQKRPRDGSGPHAKSDDPPKAKDARRPPKPPQNTRTPSHHGAPPIPCAGHEDCSRPRPAPPPDFPAGLRSICAPLNPDCSLRERGRFEDVKP